MTLYDALVKYEILTVIPLDGLEGEKFALLVGKQVGLSPAMFELFTKERQDKKAWMNLVTNIHCRSFAYVHINHSKNMKEAVHG